METISYTLPPEQDGATVRHILKAALHVSSHAISRLTRTENLTEYRRYPACTD